MILNLGMSGFVTLVAGRIDEGELGTGTTAVAFTDTDLDTPVDSTESTDADASMVKKTVTDPQLLIYEYLLSTDGDNNTYTEFGLRNQAGDVLYSRVVTTGITKDATIEVPVVVRFQFLRGQ